jgi:CubicO group peptidase (beta-lactamase class C family)
MKTRMRALLAAGVVLTMGAVAAQAVIRRFDGRSVAPERIEEAAKRMMTEAKVHGLAMAAIDDGNVVFVRAWGHRNVEKNLPLQADTIMYGASLTKFAFGYLVMQLVDEGKVGLDRSVAEYLPKPCQITRSMKL